MGLYPERVHACGLISGIVINSHLTVLWTVDYDYDYDQEDEWSVGIAIHCDPFRSLRSGIHLCCIAFNPGFRSFHPGLRAFAPFGAWGYPYDQGSREKGGALILGVRVTGQKSVGEGRELVFFTKAGMLSFPVCHGFLTCYA